MKKNIIITGAAGNLGQAAVTKFLSEGYRVIAMVSPGKKQDQPVAGVIRVEADLTNEEDVEAAIQKAFTPGETIDAALLLAGGYSGGDIYKTDGASLKKMYALNFETAYFVARPVFRQMMKQPSGGRIVLVGARPALKARDGKSSLAYALSKSLVFKLAEYLNAEGATRNVTCTVIVPSTIDTPSNRASMPQADFSSWVTPEAIANVMAFAVSEKAGPLRETILKMYGYA